MIVSLTSDEMLSYISIGAFEQHRQVNRVVDAASVHMHLVDEEQSDAHQMDQSSAMSSISRWSSRQSENDIDDAHGKQDDATDLHSAAGDHSNSIQNRSVDMSGDEANVESADEAADDRLT